MARKCPKCNTELQDSEILCPVCQMAVPRDLTKLTEEGEAGGTSKRKTKKTGDTKSIVLAVLIGLVIIAAGIVFLLPQIKRMNQPFYQTAAIDWIESEFERIVEASQLTMLSKQDAVFLDAFENEKEGKILVKCYLSTLNASSGAEEYDLYYVYLDASDHHVIKEESKCIYYGSNESEMKEYAKNNTPEGYQSVGSGT